MTKQAKAYCYALTTVALWSTVASASKITLRYLSPIQFLFISSFVSLIVLFVIIVLQGKFATLLASSKRDVMQGVGFGLLNPFGYYLLLLKAYDLLPAQQAQIINYTWALALTLLSIPFLKQRVSKGQWLAIGVSYLGVVVIATKGRIVGIEVESPLGITLALGSTFIWAIYWILNTKDQRVPVVGLFLNFLFGCPMVLIALIATEGLAGITLPGIAGAAYIGIFEMGIAFALWLQAMKLTISAAKIANLIFISPIVSLFLIYYLVGEEIYISTIAGMGLVLIGLSIQAIAK